MPREDVRKAKRIELRARIVVEAIYQRYAANPIPIPPVVLQDDPEDNERLTRARRILDQIPKSAPRRRVTLAHSDMANAHLFVLLQPKTKCMTATHTKAVAAPSVSPVNRIKKPLPALG